MLVEFWFPGVQVKVLALPLTVRVTVSPLQILLLLGTMLSVGRGSAVMAIVAVALQLAVLPLRVYIVLTVGAGVNTVCVEDPGIHVYDCAPLAVRVALLPEQTVPVTALALITSGETIMVVVIEAVPQPFVPYTV